MIREIDSDERIGSVLGTTPNWSSRAYLTEALEELSPSPSITHRRGERAILAELKRIFFDSSVPGWDGYDATPVNPTALSYAFQFISDLPADIDVPEIGSDADGDVALDWQYSRRNIFSVRISRDGTLHYAGLFGHTTRHGSETLSHGIPKTVTEGIFHAIRQSQHRA